MTAAAGSWQDALPGAAGMAPRELPRARSVLALLARFAAGQGIPASPERLLHDDVVQAFCVRGCAGRALRPAACTGRGAVSAGRAGARRAGAAGDAVRGAKAPPLNGQDEAAPSRPRSPARSVTRPGAPRRWRWWRSGSGRGCGPGNWPRCAAPMPHGPAARTIVRVGTGPAPHGARRGHAQRGGAPRLAREAGPGSRPLGPGVDRAQKNFVNFFAQSLTGGPGGAVASLGRREGQLHPRRPRRWRLIPVLLAISGIADPNSWLAIPATWQHERVEGGAAGPLAAERKQ